MTGPLDNHRGRGLRRWRVLDVDTEVANPAVLWVIVPFPLMSAARGGGEVEVDGRVFKAVAWASRRGSIARRWRSSQQQEGGSYLCVPVWRVAWET